MTRQELIAAIESQCEWDGDCLLWLRGVNSAGHPVMRGPNGEVGQMVRRLLTVARMGRGIPAGSVVRPICGSKRCLAQGHCKVMTRAEAMADAGKLGALGGTQKRISCHKSAHKKLTAADVRMVLASDESGVDLAKRLGVCHTTISAVRRGVSWRAINPMGAML